MKALLAAALTLTLSASAVMAEPATPASKASYAPYHDPCDCIQGTKVQTGVPKTVQESTPKPDDKKADRPLGTG